MTIQQEPASAFATPGTSAPRGTYGGTPTAAPAAAPAPQAAPAQGWNFLNMGNLGGISREPSSDALLKASKVVEEALKNINLDSNLAVHLLQVDNTQVTSLRLSSLVFAILRRADNKMAYHTVLLEASADAIPPRMENINGQQVPVDRFAADVYDGRYIQAVGNMIAQMFPGVEAQDRFGVVCPRGFNWDDKDQVRQFVNNAVLPCVADLEKRAAGFADINLAAWQGGEQLSALVTFNAPTRADYTGLPVRNDIAITLSATSAERQDPTTLNNHERHQTIAVVGGFIDLLWAENSAETPYGNYGNQNQMPLQKFGARFVLTSLENQMRMSVPSQLLALAAALTMSEGNSWYPYYSPRPVGAGANVKDMRDIGAINIEANVVQPPSPTGYGIKVSTKSATFNQLELGRLIQMTIRPGLTYSLDVSACGSDTWYNEVFAAAAGGNKNAINAILDAANTLTGGAFAKRWPVGVSPVLQNDERVLMGWYTGNDGARRDVRDIDYLAVMNLVGETDPHAPQAWSDTFTRTDYPLPKRLDARKKMISDLVRGDVTFTQIAQRVTYDAKFLEAFLGALRDVGLSIKPINPALHGEYVNNRGTANWLSQSSVLGGTSGVFNGSYGSSSPQVAQRQYANRW